MTSDVHSVVVEVLCEVQKMSGRKWTGIANDARPIGALDGFDSQNGIEATVMIEDKLGCKFGLDSLFVSDDGRCALTVQEIEDRLRTLTNEVREVSNE